MSFEGGRWAVREGDVQVGASRASTGTICGSWEKEGWNRHGRSQVVGAVVDEERDDAGGHRRVPSSRSTIRSSSRAGGRQGREPPGRSEPPLGARPSSRCR